MPDLRERSSGIEIMDDLSCSGGVVDSTLFELDVINKWLGGNAITLKVVRSLINDHPGKIIHIADLGCGSGEMLIQIAKWAKSNNRQVVLSGFDANPYIVAYAQRHTAPYPEIKIEHADVTSSSFRERKFDIIIGTLFFHHFETSFLQTWLPLLHQQAGIALVINDIHRHWLAYHSIKWLTKLFSSSSMVKYDAPLSVARAFSKTELRQLLPHARISWRWAFRWEVIAARHSGTLLVTLITNTLL